jgi:endonuclease VIII
MPEGDTYARAAAVARRVLEGHAVLAVAGVPDIRRRADRVVGHVVSEIRTIGKHLLVDLASGWTIHVWLGMPGRIVVAGGSSRSHIGEPLTRSEVPDTGAIRLRLETSQGTVAVIAAPTVEIERRGVIDTSLASLGPDVLAEAFDWAGYAARSGWVNPARPVAEVVLDQRVLSGIGNVYKSEILFLERVHPLTAWGRLDERSITALAHRAIALMTPNATRSHRITTGVGTPGREYWVYKRAGKPCRRCRTPIQSAEMGSPPRRTYWCPTCQTSEAPIL